MSQTEQFPDDLQILRDVYMTMANQNGAGRLSQWLAGASNAEMRQAGGFETGILLELWRRLADAGIVPFDATGIPPNPRNLNDEFDIRRIPSEFHDLSEWLRQLSPRMCEVDLVQLVGKLSKGELERLREFSTTASGEDRLERINEWLAEADWKHWDAYRIYLFTGLVDYASE